MNKLFISILLLFASQLTMAQSIKDFQWLDGVWERQGTKPGSTAFESWEKTTSEWIGQGVSMKATDTVFVEKLSIVEKEGSYYYVAEVSHNPAPTYFKITSHSSDGFICENPEHDFPKKIDYQLNGDVLTVIISGDGKEMSFVFKKKE